MKLCQQFYSGTLELQFINKSIICLIPKELDAQVIKKFRPISLVNCSFKILSKILTFRVEPILQRLIDNHQSAFLKDRYILDNVLLSHEVIHHYKHTDQQGVVVKIDFEKAYDKINWNYLLHVMQIRGFDSKWITWMASWLISSQTCVSINGSLTPYFFCKRGVRQGDPLSPYLFNLAADSLSKMFHIGREQGFLIGLGPPCDNHHAVMNCHYADDTILFLQADPKNIELTWWTMMGFEAISGIKMNLDKTELYPINLTPAEARTMAAIFQCRLSKFPFRYLGVPLSDSPLTNTNWGFLIDKFRHKLQGWKGQSLLLGGRITLINSVLSAVPLYDLSLYKIPDKILFDIDKIRRQFLWQGTQSKRKYALMCWQELCIAKQFGGMGILDLHHMNCALLLKWWWRFKDPTYSNLWKSILQANLQTTIPPSPFWKEVQQLSHICQLGVSYQSGMHGAVAFWNDT